jgi:hypothetical protein
LAAVYNRELPQSSKNAILMYVIPCALVRTDVLKEGIASITKVFHPNDGGDTLLWNV